MDTDIRTGSCRNEQIIGKTLARGQTTQTTRKIEKQRKRERRDFFL